MYICIGKLIGIEPTDTYFKRDKALLRFSKSISSQFAKTIRSNASFCIYNKNLQQNGKLGKIWMVGE